MKVSLKLAALGKSTWHDYAARFLFGGAITVIAGLIAKHYGAATGGLFLAFPAIFPASATLIEKHEIEKKHKAGLHGTRRGRESAGLDAAGAALGSLGMIVFAALVWTIPAAVPFWLVLALATVAWAGVSVLLWYLRKCRFFLRPHHQASQVHQ